MSICIAFTSGKTTCKNCGVVFPHIRCWLWQSYWDRFYEPSEAHLKLKSRKISFVHNVRFNCPIGLKFCIEYGSDTAVLCVRFQSDRSTEAWVMGTRNFARFDEFRTDILYCTRPLDWLYSQDGLVITSIIKWEWNYLSIVRLQVWILMSNFTHNITDMWLLIHGGIKVNLC